MRIEATVGDIRGLLELAALDDGDPSPSPSRQRERDSARRAVPRVLLERYESLLEFRRPVIVPIARGSCSGCHVRLPTMLESRARRAPAIHACPHCRRMLYVPELVLEASGAAASRPEPAPRSGRSRGGRS